MGDRRQIHFNDMGIWFYTHWGGSTLLKDLQNAVKAAKSRWEDSPYCFRIILSQLIGENWKEETGYGLDIKFMDSEYEDPIVSIIEKTVQYNGVEYTFEEFIKKDILE